MATVRRHRRVSEIASAGCDASVAKLLEPLELGDHRRTRMEDNVLLDKDTLAPSNAALAKQVAGLSGEHEPRRATAAEARQLSSLPSAMMFGAASERALQR